jgi:hypothetical protein
MHFYHDYTKMKKTNDETEFFDEFTIAVITLPLDKIYCFET